MKAKPLPLIIGVSALVVVSIVMVEERMELLESRALLAETLSGSFVAETMIEKGRDADAKTRLEEIRTVIITYAALRDIQHASVPSTVKWVAKKDQGRYSVPDREKAVVESYLARDGGNGLWSSLQEEVWLRWPNNPYRYHWFESDAPRRVVPVDTEAMSAQSTNEIIR